MRSVPDSCVWLSLSAAGRCCAASVSFVCLFPPQGDAAPLPSRLFVSADRMFSHPFLSFSRSDCLIFKRLNIYLLNIIWVRSFAFYNKLQVILILLMNSLPASIHNCAFSHFHLSKPKVLIAKKNGKHNIVRLFFFFHAFLEFRGAHPLVFDVSTYFPLPNFLFFCGERVLYCRQTREITGTPFCFTRGKLFFSHRISFACNIVFVPFLIRCHPIYICYI